MNNYFKEFNKTIEDNDIISIKTYAEENDIPIMNEEGISFLNFLISIKKAKYILEIGTAIGYSSIMMTQNDSVLHIDTIERDETMFKIAKDNISKKGLINKINLILSDALTYDINNLNYKYDVIFIDAAKAQYIKFFEKYSKLLNDDGIIVIDNLLFHGLVSEYPNIESKNLRALVRKIDVFNHYLKENNDYVTDFFPIGDGIAVSRRRDD